MTNHENRKMTKKMRLALMGKVVVVEKTLRRGGKDRERIWETENVEPRAGWVVGFRSLQSGTVVGDSYDNSAYLRQTGPQTPAVLVCYWPGQKPIPVPLDGFRVSLAGDLKPAYIGCSWSDFDREVYRDEALKAPRKNGHFVKVGEG